MNDSFVHKGLRRKLVDELRKKGIDNNWLLDALNKVPRHLFLPPGIENLAYQDQALPIGAGQTISQPYTVAFQTQLLQVNRGDRVLEIGTGSGYQTSILLEMGAKVLTIERQRELFLEAQKTLAAMNYRPQFFFGDGYQGLPSYAPFDRILVTAGAPFIPEPLIAQLRPGGRLVIPVGAGAVQKMTLVVKKEGDQSETTEHGTFRFVPLLQGKSNGNDENKKV
jgi:protein-L-isoaspartate(D-aspartate) O-methyltransferase